MIRKIVSSYRCFVITFSFLPEKRRQLAKRGPKTLLLPSPIPKCSQTPPAQDQGAQSAQQSITTTISGPKAPLTISLSLSRHRSSQGGPLYSTTGRYRLFPKIPVRPSHHPPATHPSAHHWPVPAPTVTPGGILALTLHLNDHHHLHHLHLLHLLHLHHHHSHTSIQ